MVRAGRLRAGVGGLAACRAGRVGRFAAVRARPGEVARARALAAPTVALLRLGRALPGAAAADRVLRAVAVTGRARGRLALVPTEADLRFGPAALRGFGLEAAFRVGRGVVGFKRGTGRPFALRAAGLGRRALALTGREAARALAAFFDPLAAAEDGRRARETALLAGLAPRRGLPGARRFSWFRTGIFDGWGSYPPPPAALPAAHPNGAQVRRLTSGGFGSPERYGPSG